MSPIVDVRQLKKQYNPPEGITAVQSVSFHINKGEIFSLLGPNGAGKTTTISMLSGLIAPTSGEATIDGHSINGDIKAVKQVIGVVPQEIALYQTISARENLMFWGKMYGLRGEKLKERVTAVLDIADLTERADDKIETYSGGMKRRINIAVGLLHNPKVLFMDEPTVGIDPQSRRRILDTVKQLNEQGLTVIYTTHYMEEAEELSHRVGIIDHGQLIAVGTQDELHRLVGNSDLVHLELANSETAVLHQQLEQLDGIEHVANNGPQLTLQLENAENHLPSIIRQAAESGHTIKQIKIQEPNLEAVFLHLTGRALRD